MNECCIKYKMTDGGFAALDHSAKLLIKTIQ